MKKEAIALALLFCMRQQMLAQDSVSISDFRYPETRAIDWKGSLNGNFGSNSTRVEVGAVQTSPRPGSGEDLRLNLGSTFLFFHSKDNHDNQLKFSGNFEFRDHDPSRMRLPAIFRILQKLATTINRGQRRLTGHTFITSQRMRFTSLASIHLIIVDTMTEHFNPTGAGILMCL